MLSKGNRNCGVVAALIVDLQTKYFFDINNIEIVFVSVG